MKPKADNYKRFFSLSRDMLCIAGFDGYFKKVNPAWERTLGFSQKELLEKPYLDFIHPDDRQKTANQAEIQTQGQDAINFENRYRCKDGSFKWLLWQATQIPEEQLIFAVARDITESKRMQEALRKSHDDLELRIQEREMADRLFHKIVEFSPMAKVVVDQKGKIVLVNAQAEKLFLYARQDLIGHPIEILIPARYRKSHPGHVAGFAAHPQTRAMGAGRDLFGLRKDGKEIPIEIGLNPIETATDRLVLAAIVDLTDRKALERGLEGQVNERTAELGKANEELRREAKEKSDLQAQLIQSQKMEAVGRLAGGVAHDFNNLLTAIGGYSHLLLGSLAPDDKRRDDVEQIKRAGERASSLTRQLLAFSRQQVLQLKVLDCNALAADLEKMLRRIIGEDVELATVLASEAGHIKADPGQIEQVILNLVVNAKDAMPKGGKITIETSNIELKEDYARMHLQIKPGPYVMFAVADTGSGMDSKTVSHLFEPFFTTKEQGKGTGLGLATVYGIVKQSGGGIYVYTEPGHGTTFKVYFPRIDEAVQTAEANPVPAKSFVGSETILLAEDDELVRAFIHRALLESGYTILVAQNPAEAIRLCEQHKNPIHLILTDVIMPQMHGPELVKRLSPLHPESKVIYMSGYTDTTVAHRDLVDSGVEFLQKPLTPDVLARRVREVLDRSV